MPASSVAARAGSTVTTLAEIGSNTGSGVPSANECTPTVAPGNRPVASEAALIFERWIELARK
jgi:hypothetical protein